MRCQADLLPGTALSHFLSSLARPYLDRFRSFRSVDLPPGQSVAPEESECGANGSAVLLEPCSKCLERPHTTGSCLSRPGVEHRCTYIETTLTKALRCGDTAEALRYAWSRWTTLTRFIDDGRVELDTNSIERSMRPIALQRKNTLCRWPRLRCRELGCSRRAHLVSQAMKPCSACPFERHPDPAPEAKRADPGSTAPSTRMAS